MWVENLELLLFGQQEVTDRERMILMACFEALEDMDFDRMVNSGADQEKLRQLLGYLSAYLNR